jgi:hypothetical protein
MIVICSSEALGLDDGTFSFSGKKGPLPGIGPQKVSFPDKVVHIAIGINLYLKIIHIYLKKKLSLPQDEIGPYQARAV